jgi:SAM-dependent methyltransferase
VKAMSGLEEPVSWLPLVQRMRCPQCGAGVTREAAGVRCVNGHHYPERHGYLDFSVPGPSSGSTEATLASFGFEWTSFDDIRAEDEAFASIYFADLDLEALTGKVGLDAGCGKGRFTRVLARHLAATVALDGSVAVEAAARNLADMDNVVVVRSDLRDAPFAPESFEFISSLGVLHHLDDPRDGFRQLVRYLAPGGQMLVYLYSRPKGIEVRSVALSAAAVVRRATVKIPHRTLKTLSRPVAAALWLGFVRPGAWGERRNVKALADLPMSTYRDKPFRSLVLDTFDRLSAPVEHRYVWSELEPWFDEAGLTVDAARDQTGWFVVAHRG